MTTLEKEFETEKATQKAAQDKEELEWLIKSTKKIRETFPSFKSLVEGGRPYCGLHLHRWHDIGSSENQQVCIKCGKLRWAIRDDPDHSHWETMGYVNPNQPSTFSIKTEEKKP